MKDRERRNDGDDPAGDEDAVRGTTTSGRGLEDEEERHVTGEERSPRELSTRDIAQAAAKPDDVGRPRAEPTEAPDRLQADPLFEGAEAERYRARWHTVQAGFVDEPRAAVEQADELVAEVIQQLAKVFADERASLEAEWGRSGDISTEDLRVALRRYRSFFDRLLSV